MVDIDDLLKQVYTVAFRLTGQEEATSALVLAALPLKDRTYQWQQNPLPAQFLITSAREVCRLFLHQPAAGNGQIKTALPDTPGQKKAIQTALLTLEPLHRVVVVWRDVAGFPVTELVPLVQQPVEDLYRILGQGRRKLQKLLA